MAGESPYDDPSRTGLNRLFNSYTQRGRANYAKLMLSCYVLTYIGYRMIRSPAAKEVPPDPEDKENTMQFALDDDDWLIANTFRVMDSTKLFYQYTLLQQLS